MMAGIWTPHVAPSGHTYFFNMKTGVSSWNPHGGSDTPGEATSSGATAAAPAAPPAPAPLPTIKRGPAKVSLKVPVMRGPLIAAVAPPEEAPPSFQPPQPSAAAAPLRKPPPPRSSQPVDRRAEYARAVAALSARAGEAGDGSKFFVK